MYAEALTEAAESSRSFKTLWWIAVLLLGAVFFGTSHSFIISARLPTSEDFDEELDVLTSTGSPLRRVSFAALGLGGLLLLALPSRRQFQLITPLVALMAGYAGFCVLSIFWSADPQITMRRLPIPVFCFFAVLGVAKQFNPRDVCWLIFTVTGAYLFLGIGAELVLGTFKPFGGDYRFSGTLHPNVQGVNCSLLVLTGLTLARKTTRGRWFVLASVCVAIALLLLTKSRTACAACAAGVWCLYYFRLRGTFKPLAVFSTGFAVCSAIVVLLFASTNFENQLYETALLGRTDQAVTLSGRLPLWNEVLHYAERRPWLGYGYGAFWNVERVQEFLYTQGWPIAHAHSGLFEPLVNVGIVGVLILLLVVVVGVLQGLYRCAVTHDEVYAFLLAQAAFAIVASVGDAFYVIPSFCATVCACSFASMAMSPKPEVRTELRSVPSERLLTTRMGASV